jgi:hypothetical protein
MLAGTLRPWLRSLVFACTPVRWVKAASYWPARSLTMENQDSRVLHQCQGRVPESCRVIWRRPIGMRSRPDSSEYHSG